MAYLWIWVLGLILNKPFTIIYLSSDCMFDIPRSSFLICLQTNFIVLFWSTPFCYRPIFTKTDILCYMIHAPCRFNPQVLHKYIIWESSFGVIWAYQDWIILAFLKRNRVAYLVDWNRIGNRSVSLQDAVGPSLFLFKSRFGRGSSVVYGGSIVLLLNLILDSQQRCFLFILPT